MLGGDDVVHACVRMQCAEAPLHNHYKLIGLINIQVYPQGVPLENLWLKSRNSTPGH